MNSKYVFELRDAFVVGSDPIEKIHRLLAERIGNTTITAECADDVSREFDSLEKLLAYENVKGKQILNLRLSALANDFQKRAYVEFVDKWYFGGTRIQIEASDEVVTKLRSNLLDITAGLRPWYFFVNKVNVFLVALVMYVSIFLGLMAFVAMRGSDTPPEATQRDFATAQLTVFRVSAAYYLVFYIIHRARRVIFPHGTFVIGQQQQRFDVMEKWRWGFVIAFIASLAAGFVPLAFQ